jgi:sulfate permease, SulP family
MSRFSALAACTALLVAALAFLAWLIRAGAVLNFVSETVLVGFKCGIALVLTSAQLPKLFGFKGSHGNFWERMGYFFQHVAKTQPLSLMLGASALVLLLLGKRFLKNKPVALVVMIAGIALESVAMSKADKIKAMNTRQPVKVPAFAVIVIPLIELVQKSGRLYACYFAEIDRPAHGSYAQ